MATVLLFGEGNHDCGEIIWIKDSREHRLVDGWLQSFIRRLSPHAQEFEAKSRRSMALLPRPHVKRPWPPGHGEKAMQAKFVAKTKKADVVVFMVDADSTDEKEWRRICAEIEEGFGKIPGPPISIVCVPMSASESWLLADAKAWRDLGLADESLLPEHPERTWGARHDPSGGHPHQVFRAVCSDAGRPDNRETRVHIAETSDLGIISKKCPVSFPPFTRAITAALV